MTQFRTELIDIVGRILVGNDWDDPTVWQCDIGLKEDVRNYAQDIVTALRPEANDPRPVEHEFFMVGGEHRIVLTCSCEELAVTFIGDVNQADIDAKIAEHRTEVSPEPQAHVKLNEWHSDCGGDWVLSGPNYFANYWPDNTVIADILDGPGGAVLDCSGIQSGNSRAECQAFAERWIRERL